eukprot:1816353-Prymnesium_polylepis.1
MASVSCTLLRAREGPHAARACSLVRGSRVHRERRALSASAKGVLARVVRVPECWASFARGARRCSRRRSRRRSQRLADELRRAHQLPEAIHGHAPPGGHQGAA